MVFPYKVKYNGINYCAGEEVPIDKVKEEKAISKEVAKSPAIKVEKLEPKVETKVEPEGKKEYNFTRSDIQKMHREELEPLAKEIGVKNTEGKRLIDIKKLTIEKLGIQYGFSK